jgi:hypothetical protein
LLDSSGTRVRCTGFGTAVTSGIRVHSPLAFITTYTLTIDRVLSASLTRRVRFPYRASLIPTPGCTRRTRRSSLMCTGFGTGVTSGIRVHSPLAFFTTYTLTIDRVLSARLTRRVSFPYRASLIVTPGCTSP